MTSKVRWRRSWFPLWYGYCPDEKEYRKELKKSAQPDYPWPDTAGAAVQYDVARGAYFDRHCLVIINVDWENEPDVAMGLLVHECVHVVEAIVENMADKNPSEEFRAYATQAIFSELLRDISEYHQKAKRK